MWCFQPSMVVPNGVKACFLGTLTRARGEKKEREDVHSGARARLNAHLYLCVCFFLHVLSHVLAHVNLCKICCAHVRVYVSLSKSPMVFTFFFLSPTDSLHLLFTRRRQSRWWKRKRKRGPTLPVYNNTGSADPLFLVFFSSWNFS